ncbi:hypothetical protein BJY01DRAFT_210031 [Aspergillus pseudoustus]|uniref:Uncharacterized protein n=1 Tax=Aspergillus pseudoustus TaxID=1810923 RepID=A0ABR4KE52_9EURO
MAPRPELYPLKTPSQLTFPSELQEYLRATSAEPTRQNITRGPSVQPPQAYTEFLKALSPVFGSPSECGSTPYTSYPHQKQIPSPQSLPSATSITSFPGEVTPSTKAHTSSGHTSPSYVPRSAVEPRQYRRIRMSPHYVCSPTSADSPKSAHPLRSPYPPVDRRVRYVESPSSAGGRSITIQHIITHTVTLKRVPSLAPPPKGKRRRANQSQK